jgi:acyl dehydratase
MAEPRVFAGRAELEAATGEEIGVSDWYEVGQAEVDAFAATSGDRNPIHVDPDYAVSTPFGSTIAHGLFTLSLGPMFNYSLFDVSGLGEAVNYGYDRVRFPAPVPIPARVRMRLTLAAVEAKGEGAQITLDQTFERDGGDRPACVASLVIRYLGRL